MLDITILENKTVYFVDQNKLTVESGILDAVYRDKQSNHGCVYIEVPVEGKESETAKVEASLVSFNKAEVEAKLTEITPLIEEARALDLDTRNKIDVIREKVIGKPLV